MREDLFKFAIIIVLQLILFLCVGKLVGNLNNSLKREIDNDSYT